MSKKNKGSKFEDRVRKTINSGSMHFDKGDLSTSEHVIECKFTEKKSFRITTKILEKIWNDALEAQKLPALVVGIKDKDCMWTLNIRIQKEAR